MQDMSHRNHHHHHLHNNHRHPHLQHHNSLPGNYPTPQQQQQQQHLDLSLNATGATFAYNAVMPSNEIISCPLTSGNGHHNPVATSFSSSTTSASSAVFFQSSVAKTNSAPVKLKFWGSGGGVFKRRRRRSSTNCSGGDKQRNPKQSLDKTNSYLLWIGTPVAARWVCIKVRMNMMMLTVGEYKSAVYYFPVLGESYEEFGKESERERERNG